MKKYFTLLLVAIFGFLVVSCERSTPVQQQDNDTFPTTLDINNVSFTYTVESGYHIKRSFTTALPTSYAVLIYRQAGTTNGSPVWQPIPRTFYLDNGKEFDYDFDFSRYDVFIYADGNYDISTSPQLLTNQTFRVLVVPSAQGGKPAIDLDDYESVIKYYNIDDSKPVKL